MRLFYSPGACSLSVHVALIEAGIEVELIRVDLAHHTLPDGTDYRGVHALGYVPVLELDDGQRLAEVPAVLQYIADRAPAARLAPAAGTLGRTRLQEWLGFISSELHQGFGILFNRSMPDAVRPAMIARLRERLDWVDRQMQRRTFALGDAFSVADAYLFVVLGWTRIFGLNISEWPALARHARTVGDRPAVRAAMRAEGLLQE